MYEVLIVTPEFENYSIDSKNIETCPVLIEMKLWTKEWIVERVLYTRNTSGQIGNNIDKFIQEAIDSGQITIESQYFISNDEIFKEVTRRVLVELDKECHADSLIPLKEFICDSCGKKISVNDNPAIEYYEGVEFGEAGTEYTINGLRIIHNHEDCSYSVEEKGLVFTTAIDNTFLGRNQISMLLALKECKVDSVLFDELFKRLTIPYYEEARMHMDEIETSMKSLDWAIQKYNRHVLRDIVLNNSSQLKIKYAEILETKNK